MTTNQTVWVCIATYEARSGVEPICAVAFTAQEAEEQIANVIHERCNGDEEYMKYWVSHPPIERPVLPVSPDMPKGVEAWKAAGIPEADIERWFDIRIEDLYETFDAKDAAHQEAEGMTVEDFLGDWEEITEDDDGEDEE
jgi:hypothetical protein